MSTKQALPSSHEGLQEVSPRHRSSALATHQAELIPPPYPASLLSFSPVLVPRVHPTTHPCLTVRGNYLQNEGLRHGRGYRSPVPFIAWKPQFRSQDHTHRTESMLFTNVFITILINHTLWISSLNLSTSNSFFPRDTIKQWKVT